MTRADYDLFVVGGGSGGVRAARIAAELGARVALAEQHRLGGTCVNVGCIPKKLLVYGARMRELFDEARAYGWEIGAPRHEWPLLKKAVTDEVARLNGVYARILGAAGVELIEDRAVLTGPNELDIEGRRVTADHILIATGGHPARPDFPGAEHVAVSDDAFALEARPERVVLIGGGYIALEFAGIFHGLGSDVTLVHRRADLLRGFDRDVTSFVQEGMHDRGVTLCLERTVKSLERAEDGTLSLMLDGADLLEADLVLAAVGRRPNTRGLGLERAGVACADDGGIIVDDGFRTNVPSIFAVGDVIDGPGLTPTALAEGMAVARHLFGGAPSGKPYDLVPTAVFTDPEVATVGLTEREARSRGPVTVYRSVFTPLRHTIAGRRQKMMVKLVVHADTDRVLGCHVVGEDAAEIVQGIAAAMTAGATKAHLDRTIGIHPTAAEELVTLRDPLPDPE